MERTVHDCKWQTRDDMPSTTNPLQWFVEVLTGTSRDLSEDKLLSAMYGVIVGWDDGSYEELKEKNGWSNEVVEKQKALHKEFIKCWDKYMPNEKETPAI